MNYLKEIVAFQEWLEVNPLPPNAQVLWYQLIHVANKLNKGVEWVQVDTRRLMIYSSINNKDNFIKSRNTLIDKGLIEYKRGSKGEFSSYRIIPFESQPNNKEKTNIKKCKKISFIIRGI